MSAEWTDKLRSICAERCGEFGDPPCLSIVKSCEPCEDCLTEAYGPPAPAPYRCPSTIDIFGGAAP